MASEQELRAARLAHARQLQAAKTQAYPNDYKADDELRRSAVAQVNDARVIPTLPKEGSLRGDEPEYPLFGRVVAKRGPFLVIRTPHGDAQALVRTEAAEGLSDKTAPYIR